jgi:hypothetical protein
LSGTLTSQISGGAQTCNIPLPPYAKSGACSIATFDEQGSIVFEQFTLDAPSTQHVTIAIPHQTLNGLLLAITEIQPVPATGNRLTTGFLAATRNLTAHSLRANRFSTPPNAAPRGAPGR